MNNDQERSIKSPTQQKIIYVDNFLSGHGHTPTTGTTLVKLFKAEGYNVIPTSSKDNKALRLLDMVSTIVANRKNAIVLIATYSTSAFYFACTCAFICRFYNIPYIPCLHGGNLPDRIKASPKLSQTLFGKSFTNVAVSDYLNASMTANSWKCIEIPNNININNYQYRKRTNAQPKLIWIRSFHKIYNPLLAIDIISDLIKKYPAAHLTMIGPDKDGSLKECKDEVQKRQLQSNVTFTGLLKTAELTGIAQNHDIFINTTNFDNLPVSVVEAMALGLIVISTNVGGVPYLVQDGANGILVPPKNKEAFIQAIEKVLINNQFATQLSEKARLKALKFDWQNIKLLWNNLFNEVFSTRNKFY